MLADVQVRFHDDVAGFASVAVPLLQRDPVLHTVELTLLRPRVCAPLVSSPALRGELFGGGFGSRRALSVTSEDQLVNVLSS